MFNINLNFYQIDMYNFHTWKEYPGNTNENILNKKTKDKKKDIFFKKRIIFNHC